MAALIGLFIGRFSEGLMAGVVYIKIIMLVFIAVPILCALIGVDGPLAVVCSIVPSQPAFEEIKVVGFCGGRRSISHSIVIFIW